MKAVVLVGGEGTRLRPLTLSEPKQMQPIALLPMIERVAEQLAAGGVDDIVFSLGYKPDIFVEAFPDQSWRGIPIHFAVEPPSLLDTAGAIAFAARSANITETFVAVNGDVLTDIKIDQLVEFHKQRKAKATIALIPVPDPSQFGVVATDSEGRVQSFIEKPAPGTAPTDNINAGLYVLEPSVLDLINEGDRVSIERETFPTLTEAGELFAFASEAYWLDTGTPEKFIQANMDFVSGLRGNEPVPGAIKQGSNWFVGTVDNPNSAENSLIGARAVVAGSVSRSVIGNGVVVEDGAQVSDSVLMDNVVVGAGSRVSDSIIGRGAHIGANSSITNVSIVGYGCKVDESSTIDGGRIE